jgi:hypothetical protein
VIAPTPAVAPSDEVAVVLQMAGVGALLGTAVAARRKRREPAADTWLFTARWTLALAALGVLIVIAAVLR